LDRGTIIFVLRGIDVLNGNEGTYELAAVTQVNSAVVIFKSSAIRFVMTVVDPMTNDEVPIAIVAVSTKRTSWKVDLKHAGLAACLAIGGVVGDVGGLPSGVLLSPTVFDPGLVAIPASFSTSAMSAVIEMANQPRIVVKNVNVLQRVQTMAGVRYGAT
jgi:hypothetical protein